MGGENGHRSVISCEPHFGFCFFFWWGGWGGQVRRFGKCFLVWLSVPDNF